MSGWPEIHPSRLLASLYSAAARDYAELWAPVLRPTSEQLIAAMPLAGPRGMPRTGRPALASMPAEGLVYRPEVLLTVAVRTYRVVGLSHRPHSISDNSLSAFKSSGPPTIGRPDVLRDLSRNTA